MPSHALLPPDTHPHASALPPRCPTPFRAMPSCPGITLHGNAPLSLPGRRAHAEARTGTQTGAQAGAGPALRQYAAEQKIRHTAPDTTARHLTTEQLAAHFRRHTTAAALIPRHTPSHTSAPEHASAPERASAPGTHIHAGPADPHCRSAPSTHARTKKRSTLADASPLFGNVESVTRPERNACRQLR